MTKRARIRKLMRENKITKIVYSGPLQIMGSDEWSKTLMDCDFYFSWSENPNEPFTIREFRDNDFKDDLREIERLCYYLFDFKSGTIYV